MTKQDLIEFLQPFTDNIEIRAKTANGVIVPAKVEYLVLVDGEGIVLLEAVNG